MEARIVSFPSQQAGVRVSGDRIEVDRLTLADGPLAAWLAAQPLDDHAILVERALRIGLTALQIRDGFTRLLAEVSAEPATAGA